MAVVRFNDDTCVARETERRGEFNWPILTFHTQIATRSVSRPGVPGGWLLLLTFDTIWFGVRWDFVDIFPWLVYPIHATSNEGAAILETLL